MLHVYVGEADERHSHSQLILRHTHRQKYNDTHTHRQKYDDEDETLKELQALI